MKKIRPKMERERKLKREMKLTEKTTSRKSRGEVFAGTDTDLKQGDGAPAGNGESDSTDDDESDEKSDFYLHEIALALAEGDLDEKRLGMLKDGFLRLFA